VLNQNISACEELYFNRAIDTRLLLGPKFALLRREFMANRATAHAVPDKARKLLVTMGGADADNVTQKVIDALADMGLEIRVAVGGSNPHLASLRQAKEAALRETANVNLAVDSREMPQLMAWAHFAVAAAGSTSWELAFSGLPTLFIILAGNQAGNAREMERRGFGLCLGEHTQFDEQRLRDSVSGLAEDRRRRTDFASRGRQMVDGRGAARIARALGA
jgi:spore coat polysaccharide biosynthesis predicted glycosyltransferase SpsG